jgi:HEAT repeat protein
MSPFHLSQSAHVIAAPTGMPPQNDPVPVPLEALIAAAHRPDPATRITAVYDLAPLAAEHGRALETLVSLLADANGEVRNASALALGSAGAGAVQPLMECLVHRSHHVRQEAIRALGIIGPAASPAVPRLMARLFDGSLPVRIRAADALGRIGPSSAPAAPSLVDCLTDGQAAVRRAAAEALVAIGAEAAEAVVRAMPRTTAKLGLALEPVVIAIGADAVPALIEALARPELRAREGATYALAQIGPPARAAVPALLPLLADKKARVADAVAEALAHIGGVAPSEVVPWLGHESPDVRARAARLLAELGDVGGSAPLALVARLDDSVPKVREAAARALRAAGAGAVEALSKGLSAPSAHAVRASASVLADLGADADAVARQLAGPLAHEDAGVRAAACRAVAGIAAAAPAVPPTAREEKWHAHLAFLTDLVGDADPTVREAAATALGHIGGIDAEAALSVALEDSCLAVRKAARRASALVAARRADAATC